MTTFRIERPGTGMFRINSTDLDKLAKVCLVIGYGKQVDCASEEQRETGPWWIDVDEDTMDTIFCEVAHWSHRIFYGDP